MLTLAATNAVAIWLFVGQMIFNLIIGIGGWWAMQKIRKIDQLEDEVQRRTDQAINNRFGQMHSDLMGEVKSLNEQVRTIFKRLDAGEAQFTKLSERDQSNELKLLNQVNELSKYIHDKLATKDEIKELHQRIQRIEQERAFERGKRERANEQHKGPAA